MAESRVPFSGSSLEDKTLPPPPPEGSLEIVTRTMALDLEILAKNGGAVRYADRVRSSYAPGGSGFENPILVNDGGKAEKIKQSLIWTAIFIGAAALLFLVGFYLVPMIIDIFGGSGSDGANSQANQATTTKQSFGKSSEKTVEPVNLGHISYFKSSIESVPISLYENSLPRDRASFLENIKKAALESDSNIVEITPEGADGKQISWSTLMELIRAGNMDKKVLKERFQNDYTMFAYRDRKGGVWPGFIFKLKTGETPLLLAREILELETDTFAYANMFLSDPGLPVGGFADIQVSGQPARSLIFSKSSSTYIYSWLFNTYLILSAHEEGIRAAVLYL